MAHSLIVYCLFLKDGTLSQIFLHSSLAKQVQEINKDSKIEPWLVYTNEADT